MVTKNLTDSNWIPYGQNDSLSAVVFTTGSDTGMEYMGTGSAEIMADDNATTSTVTVTTATTTGDDLELPKLSWNSSSSSSSSSWSPDYGYGWNVTTYDASLSEVAAENGSSLIGGLYDDLITGDWTTTTMATATSMTRRTTAPPSFYVYNVTTTSPLSSSSSYSDDNDDVDGNNNNNNNNGTFAAAFADGDVWSKVSVYAYNDSVLMAGNGSGINMSVSGTTMSANVVVVGSGVDSGAGGAGVGVVAGDGNKEFLYPSGHSDTTIAIAATVVTLIMITVVVGNMLVIVAIATEKNLKTIQNWFIASLAVADFFIGLVVMPFSLAKELMGYWIFGTWWCEIHLALDVLLCTSSILNLCLISLDRYWSITQAVDYLKKRTASRAAVMITIVWVLAFLISVPPLVSWNKMSEPQGEIPICELSKDTLYVVYSASGSFFIPSVIMVFVYVQIYFAARSRARRVVKRHRPTLDPTKDKSTTTTSFSNTSPPDKTKNAPGTPRCGEMPTIGEAPSVTQPFQQQQLLVPPSTMTTPTGNVSFIGDAATDNAASPNAKRDGAVSFQADVTTTAMAVTKARTRTASARSPSPASNNNSSNGGGGGGSEKHRLQVQLATPTSSPLQRANTVGSCSGSHLGSRMFGMVLVSAAGGMAGSNSDQRQVKANGTSSRSFKVKASPSRLVSQAHALAQAQAQILLADEMECLSEFDHSSDSDQLPTGVSNGKPVLSGFRRLTLLCNPSSKKSSSASTTATGRSNATPGVSSIEEQEMDMAVRVVVPPKPRDPEREKRRIARKKERRATLILGLIMAAFILCWLPFFTLYLVRAVCSCFIDDILFAVTFWLGYCNSVLNPVIYTIFNKDFRKAFRKILFK